MDYFLLDAVTGELRTARPLDRESLDNPAGVLVLNIKVSVILVNMVQRFYISTFRLGN